MQFLQEKELIETLVALESETGLKYVDAWNGWQIRSFLPPAMCQSGLLSAAQEGDLPVASVLQSSLDMYSRAGSDEKEEDSDAKANLIKSCCSCFDG